MHTPFKLDRRQALALGLGAAAAPFLPGVALAQEKMQILVAYYGALVNAGIVAIGQEKGFYKTPAVDASDVVSTIGGGTAIRNMIGGGVEYGIVGTSAALTAIRSGVDVRIVHGVIRTLEDLTWVSLTGSNIRSIQDLKGKKIGFTRPQSISETMAKAMLEKNGMVGQAQLVSLGSVAAGLSALEAGGVDATLINEPLWSQRKDRYQTAFTLESMPAASQMVGVATADMIRKKPEVLRDLIGAYTKSVDFTYANPEEAGRLMAKRYGSTSLAPDVAASAVSRMVKIRYWSRGEIEMPGLEVWLDIMKKQGEIEGSVDLAKAIDTSFLPKELQ